jgi:N-formylglutamate deformylase
MDSMPSYEVERRGGPLVISIPHLGTYIPPELVPAYTVEALAVADTDWHLDRIYDFADRLDATLLRARISRYVIDLNRPATGESLYPGMITTTLCPAETFRGESLYHEGREPDAQEVSRRVADYWRPYHRALRDELARLRERHPNILLWDAHSIASQLPRLFQGTLPDLNFGTSDGDSCHPDVVMGAVDPARQSGFSWVLNGRFKGGFITRKYGNPHEGVHAIQLEMAQTLYMDERAPFGFIDDLAAKLKPTVLCSIQGALDRLGRLDRGKGR